MLRCCMFFFFSSRRRHTRLQGDWSSDVCSSDLAVALEKILRAQLGAIRQQRDPQKLFLLREIDRVFEQLRSVSVAAKRIVDDEIFEEDYEPAFSGADGKKQVDHADNRAVAPEHEDASAIRFLEDQAQPLELFRFIGPAILFFTEKLSEKIRQFVQILENGRLDDDFAHGRFVIPQSEDVRNARIR